MGFPSRHTHFCCREALSEEGPSRGCPVQPSVSTFLPPFLGDVLGGKRMLAVAWQVLSGVEEKPVFRSLAWKIFLSRWGNRSWKGALTYWGFTMSQRGSRPGTLPSSPAALQARRLYRGARALGAGLWFPLWACQATRGVWVPGARTPVV